MSELATCPICGAKILPSVVPMYDDGLDASTASCFNGKCLYRVRREDHNTLARRAEIGALVERIVAAEKGLLTIGRTPCRDGSQIYSAWSSRPVGEALSLLDALRELEKEVCGE